MIPKKEIDKIAYLCRLKLDDREAEKYGQQLSSIIDHFELLSELETEGVEPTFGIYQKKHVLRSDRVEKFSDTAELLKCPTTKLKKNLFVTKSVF